MAEDPDKLNLPPELIFDLRNVCFDFFGPIQPGDQEQSSRNWDMSAASLIISGMLMYLACYRGKMEYAQEAFDAQVPLLWEGAIKLYHYEAAELGRGESIQ